MKKQSTTRSAALKAVALALLLPGFFCSAGRAQTMETITNSILAFEGLLANVSPTQEVVYVGDMGFPQSSLRAWTWQLRRMAGLPTGPVPNAMFDLNYAAWTDGVMPYTYAPNMPQATINTFEAAMREWQKAANLKFIPRTIEAINYIYVQTNTGGNSFVGMRGGAQVINIDASASMVECAHELGHALGMEHEQCRTDRDTYVKMHWENFLPSLGDPRTNVNFAIVYNSTNFGPYDYASIQEYPNTDGNTARTNGCSDPQCTQIEPLDPYYTAAGRPYMYWGATNLSAGDKVGMAGRYGVPRTISGQVRNGPNGPFAGVTVTISGGVSYRGPASVTTDANGNYSFIGIPNNSGTFVVSATLGGHSFVPPSWNVNMGTTDFTTANFRDADTSPPTVTINSPANNGAVSLLTSIGGTASDVGSGLQLNQIHFTLFDVNNGNFWSGSYWTNTVATDPSILLTASVVNGAWTFTSVPTGGAQVEGTYFISAFARDNAGNLSTPQSGVNNTRFTIDRGPPQVAITSPTNGTVLMGSLSPISGTASDNNGVQLVRLYIIRLSDNAFWDGTAWAGGGSAILPTSYDQTAHTWVSTGPLPVFGGSDPRTAMSNGSYDLIAIAYDPAGNQQRADSIVTVNYHPIFTYTGQACCPPPPGVPGDPSDWFDARNWSPSGVPGSTDVAIIDGFSVHFGTSVIVAGLVLRSGSLTGGSLGFNPSDPGNGLDWQGGTLACNLAIQANGQLTISGSADKQLYGGSILNLGVATWSGTGNLVGLYYGAITNSGEFDMVNDASFTSGGGGVPVFENLAGAVLRKSGGTNVTTFGGFLLGNSGVVDIQSGVLSLQGINHTFADGSDLRGLGRIRVDGTTVTLNGNITLETGATFELASGTVNGATTLLGSGTFVWSGGVLQGSMSIGANANLSLSGSADKRLNGGSILNLGVATWSGTGNLVGLYYGAITNSGLFDIRTDAGLFDGGGGVPSIYNLGTVLKSAGGGTNLCDFAFNNNGTVDLRSGVLALSGGYTPSSTSQLKLAIGGLAPGTQFSQLNLGGAAALAGTLSVTLTNGFSPTNGQSFAIVTYASESGQFASQQLPALPNTLAWQVNYGATAVTLDVLRAKILNNASLLANGHFQFSVDGPNSSSVIIQGTTNLVDWISLQTNAPFTGSLLFDEAVDVAYPGRFYRAIFEP